MLMCDILPCVGRMLAALRDGHITPEDVLCSYPRTSTAQWPCYTTFLVVLTYFINMRKRAMTACSLCHPPIGLCIYRLPTFH